MARQAIAAMRVVAEGSDDFIPLKRFGVRVDIEKNTFQGARSNLGASALSMSRLRWLKAYQF
jgi:hypothetical protein